MMNRPVTRITSLSPSVTLLGNWNRDRLGAVRLQKERSWVSNCSLMSFPLQLIGVMSNHKYLEKRRVIVLQSEATYLVWICPNCRRIVFRWNCQNCGNTFTRLVGVLQECPVCHHSWDILTCAHCGYTEERGQQPSRQIWTCPSCRRGIDALICPQCRSESDEFSSVCKNCGTRSDCISCSACGYRHYFAKAITCPQCGRALRREANFCRYCGRRVIIFRTRIR